MAFLTLKMMSKTTKNIRSQTNKKNPGTKKRNSIDYTSKVPAMFGFIKPRQLVTLKYFDFIPLSVTTLAVSQYTFRLNSLFDPDRTGTGHQPYGRDTLAALYNRYRVYKTGWRVEMPSNSQTFSAVVVPSNGTFTATTLADFTLAIELPYSKYQAIGAAGAPPGVFESSINLAQLGGVPRVEFDSDDRFAANFSSNPTEVQDLEIIYYNPNGSTLTTQLNIELWFKADAYDLINQAQS